MTAIAKVRTIQDVLAVTVDGIPGVHTEAAWEALKDEARAEMWAAHRPSPGKHPVKASSFADPADVVAFNACKARGGSDQHCFKFGDNGIGAWGHATAQDHTPMAALPREVWKAAGKTGGARLAVNWSGKRVEGILGDTMPSVANIKNGAGIDLNPAFAKSLGLNPPFLVDQVTWEWV